MKWIPTKDMLTELQMTSPGLLRTFGDMEMGGVKEEDNLKIDSVLPDKLKKTDRHFKRLEDKSVSEVVRKQARKTIVCGSADWIASPRAI